MRKTFESEKEYLYMIIEVSLFPGSKLPPVNKLYFLTSKYARYILYSGHEAYNLGIPSEQELL